MIGEKVVMVEWMDGGLVVLLYIYIYIFFSHSLQIHYSKIVGFTSFEDNLSIFVNRWQLSIYLPIFR